jgi:hypothetical protein
MRIEIILFIITAFIMANIYTDGKYLKLLFTWKKYYQMAGVAVGAFVLYYLFKKNPFHAKQIVSASNEYIKYLPIDKNTANMISPILDFTSKQEFYNESSNQHPFLAMNPPQPMASHGERTLMQSGKKTTKRSVSETKKKFIASRQNWKCGDCQKQLNAWFEVDHIKRLEYGGDNHIDNLVALCRECHGKKTTIENL